MLVFGKRISAKLIIGDIHGYFHVRKLLLEKINYRPIQDQAIFIGDYISRGPESLKVVSEIKRMVEEEDAITLKMKDIFLYTQEFVQGIGEKQHLPILSG
ncbi:metallophosphoesterase [Brevibacillus sp. DP1.3A]|nr:metallophosphoesterase [Brevibacillus sp. DP1.3A]